MKRRTDFVNKSQESRCKNCNEPSRSYSKQIIRNMLRQKRAATICLGICRQEIGQKVPHECSS